jgi:hypothetical protein
MCVLIINCVYWILLQSGNRTGIYFDTFFQEAVPISCAYSYKMTEKRQTSQGYILSAFYNIVQQNLGILLILWRSFELWWNFCLDLSRSKFCSLGNRSITLSLLWQTDLGRGANAIFFQGGVRTKDRFFSPGTDFAARANYILLRSYRINSNAIIFQFLLF